MTDTKPKQTTHASVIGAMAYNPWLEVMRSSMAMGAEAMRQTTDMYMQYWEFGTSYQRTLMNNYFEMTRALGEENASLAREWLERSQDPKELTVPMRDFLRDKQQWFRPFQQWVEQKFKEWEVPPIDELAYQFTKDGVATQAHIKTVCDNQIKYLPEPQKTWARFMVMFNEEFFKMFFKEGPSAWLESLAILSPGDNRLSKPDRNNLFLTENSAGDIVAIDEDEIIALFPVADEVNGAKESFPRLLITSSHADGSKDSNMTDITHGIRALVRDTQNGDRSMDNGEEKGLPLTYYDGSLAAEPEKVLMLFACDSERNNSWNASRLTARMAELDKVVTGGKDEFKEISPGAKRIARLMLRCMLQEPSELPSYATDKRSVREILSKTGGQLLLRNRPELIAQHFLLMGYSKGGNVVSDALRYVISELQAKNPDGRDIFAVQHEHQHKYDITAHGDVSIRNIIRNIGCISMAALENKLTSREKSLGMRRLSFKNIHDPIANQRDFDGTLYDENIPVVGAESTMAHEPKKAMGKLETDIPEHRRQEMTEDEIAQDIKGYCIKDPRVTRRLREAFAPYCGKAAIYDIRPGHHSDEEHHMRECVVIETAPGTTDAMFANKKDKLMRAFTDKNIGGLKNVRMEAEGGNAGIFRLYFDDPLFEADGETINPETETKLRNSFMTLRGSQTAGLVIAQEIVKKLGGPEAGVESGSPQRT